MTPVKTPPGAEVSPTVAWSRRVRRIGGFIQVAFAAFWLLRGSLNVGGGSGVALVVGLGHQADRRGMRRGTVLSRAGDQEVTDGRGKAVGQATDSLSVGRGFGAAIDRDGTLIIPVAWVAGGGGAGGADVSTQNQPDGDDPRRQDKPDGGGGGFGGFTWPLGVYVVKNGEVRLGAGCRCYSCRSGRDCPRPHGGEALGRQPRESTGLTIVDRARHELHPEKSIH
jgi:uncharacterized spore protein YtfJ